MTFINGEYPILKYTLARVGEFMDEQEERPWDDDEDRAVQDDELTLDQVRDFFAEVFGSDGLDFDWSNSDQVYDLSLTRVDEIDEELHVDLAMKFAEDGAKMEFFDDDDHTYAKVFKIDGEVTAHWSEHTYPTLYTSPELLRAAGYRHVEAAKTLDDMARLGNRKYLPGGGLQ